MVTVVLRPVFADVAAFNLILMDIMMPEMNGYEVTGVIRAMKYREDAAGIPIIAMTNVCSVM